MKRDYIYQDKGQYRMMYNAEKIGGFLVSDQDAIIDDNVLPEQRFTHQPIFRRPPEELITVFSYRVSIRGSIVVVNKLKKKTTEAGVDLEYTYRGGDLPRTGASFWLKNWSEEAKAVPSYPGGPLIGDSMEGDSLRNLHWPVFFKDYVWFIAPDSTGVFYSKIKPNGYETKEIKVAFQDPDKSVYAIYFIYRETGEDGKVVYKMVVDKQVAVNPGRGYPGYTWLENPPYWRHMVQYKSESLSGPWVYEKTWETDFSYIYWWNDGPWRLLMGSQQYPDGIGLSWDNYVHSPTAYDAYIYWQPNGTWFFYFGREDQPLPPGYTYSNEGGYHTYYFPDGSILTNWRIYVPGNDFTYEGQLSTTVWDSFVLEFASLILSKHHNQLSLAVGEQGRQDNMMRDVLTQVYSPPFIRFGRNGFVESRGREGEIAVVPPTPTGYTNVKYLVKRLGNGQIQKTFITRLAWPEWFPS